MPPKIVTAESITAGGIAALLQDLSPQSQTTGFVVYSDDAKKLLLNVNADLLREKGAVCSEVASQMAQGAIAESGADYAVAVTGYAGQSRDRVRNIECGTVFIAVAHKQNDGQVQVKIEEYHFEGNRTNDRTNTILAAFRMLNKQMLENGDPEIPTPELELFSYPDQGNADDPELAKRFGKEQVLNACHLLQSCTQEGIKFSIVENSTAGKIFNFFTSFNGSSTVFGTPGIIDKTFNDQKFSYLKNYSSDVHFILFADDQKLKLFSYSNKTAQLLGKFDLDPRNPFQTSIDAANLALAHAKNKKLQPKKPNAYNAPHKDALHHLNSPESGVSKL